MYVQLLHACLHVSDEAYRKWISQRLKNKAQNQNAKMKRFVSDVYLFIVYLFICLWLYLFFFRAKEKATLAKLAHSESGRDTEQQEGDDEEEQEDKEEKDDEEEKEQEVSFH